MPAKNYALKIRFTKDQRLHLEQLSESYGYATLSEFIRSRIFESQILLKNQIDIKKSLDEIKKELIKSSSKNIS